MGYYSILVIYLVFLVLTILKNNNKSGLSKETVLYSHVNKIHKLGEIAIMVLAFLGGLTALVLDKLQPHYFLIALIALYGYRGIMEWKYQKHTKQYTITIFIAGFFLIVFMGIELEFILYK